MNKKVVIVTGGASGIGLAAGLEFSGLGYQVILADIQNPPKRILVEHAELHYTECDVRAYTQVELLFLYRKESFGRLDVLVNVAGVHNSLKLHEGKIFDFDNVLQTNLNGTMYCCREAVKLMDEGVIINIASSVGIAADKDAPAYSTSKAAVIHFTKCIAQAYGQRIKCNAISPGPIDTPLLRRAFPNDPNLDAVRAMNPRGVETPEKLAKLIAFMASDDCQFVNGANWIFDGGESIIYAGEPPK